MQRLAELLIAAVLLAGLYATMAYGLGLIYGVLRVVNLAHGGLIMAGAYGGWWAPDSFGIDPHPRLPPGSAGVFLFSPGAVPPPRLPPSPRPPPPRPAAPRPLPPL